MMTHGFGARKWNSCVVPRKKCRSFLLTVMRIRALAISLFPTNARSPYRSRAPALPPRNADGIVRANAQDTSTLPARLPQSIREFSPAPLSVSANILAHIPRSARRTPAPAFSIRPRSVWSWREDYPRRPRGRLRDARCWRGQAWRKIPGNCVSGNSRGNKRPFWQKLHSRPIHRVRPPLLLPPDATYDPPPVFGRMLLHSMLASVRFGAIRCPDPHRAKVQNRACLWCLDAG